MKGILNKIEDLSVLIDSLNDLVRVVRPDRTVAMANRAMREKFGADSCDKCFTALGGDRPCEDCLMKRVAEGTERLYKEKEIDGIHYSIKASPLYDTAGEFLGCIEVYRDITPEVQIRQRLMRANAKMTRDLLMAQGLQAAMFRKELPEPEGYRLTMGFYPCDAVGGDACDCISLPDGKVLLYVADVSGHGVRAAMLTVFLRQEIIMHAKAKAHIDLTEMTELIRRSFMELNADDATYITLFLMLLDPATGECRYVNAGHSVAPLICGEDGIRELFAPGPPVCRWSAAAGSPEGKLLLEKGQRVVLFTDGVMENCGDMDAETFFREQFARRDFDPTEFIGRINDFHEGSRNDDILLMVCERTA